MPSAPPPQLPEVGTPADAGVANPAVPTAAPATVEPISQAPSDALAAAPASHARDPWAHRRGEPRLFAFLWTIYILIAVAGSILWVSRFAVVSPDTFSPAARIMLVVIAIGATVLWPMVRLSQASPPRGVLAHAVADTVVVLLPVQLVIWPLVVLAGWPFLVVATVAGTIMVWITLTGGLLALALGGRPVTAPADAQLLKRSIWMCAMLAVVLAAPASMLVYQVAHRAVPEWVAMLSPITAISAVSGSGAGGPQNPVSALELKMLGLTAALSAGVWMLGLVRSLFGNRAERA